MNKKSERQKQSNTKGEANKEEQRNKKTRKQAKRKDAERRKPNEKNKGKVFGVFWISEEAIKTKKQQNKNIFGFSKRKKRTQISEEEK